MANKKIIFIMFIFISLFSISTVFAQDNITCENDVIMSDETSVVENTKTFSDLNRLIQESAESDIYLDDNYAYNEDSDSDLSDGISIDKQVNIFGNGHVTIDGSNKARIFNIVSQNVFLNGITFINGNAFNGGAITGSSYGVINCKFTGNNAENNGGAMYGGSASYCTFTDNNAVSGGAIYGGSATNCEFKSNTADYGGAIFNTYADTCVFSYNEARIDSGAMKGNSALNCNFTKNSAGSYGAGSKATFTGCNFFTNTASKVGGAIGDEGCSATNCNFTDNSAIEAGGAVYKAYIDNCQFRDNHATYGGAISGTGDSVVNSMFADNYANERGGALNNVFAVKCEFRRNHAREGGAIFGNSAKNCTFISNFATDSSGGIKGYAEDCYFVDNSAYRAGAVEGDARNSIFEENHAITGGAMYVSSAVNCQFIKNYAEEGGALYGSSAEKCTFTENKAKTGAGMYSGSSTNSNFMNNVAEVTGGAYYKTAVSDCYLQGNLPKYILEVSDFRPTFGFSGEVSINLKDSKNGAINNVKLSLKAYDKYNRVVFVSNCYSGGTCPVNLDLGEFTLVVSVVDKNYDIESVSRYVHIKKFTSIYMVSVTATYAINNPLIINLHDIDGGVLSYTSVKVNLNGAVKTYTTNKFGQVLLSTAGLAPNSYKVSVNFAGTNNYHPCSASAYITVKKAKPFIIVSNMKYYKSEKVKKFYMILKDNRYRVMKNVKVTVKVNGKTYSAKTNSKGRATFKITKLKKKGKFTATVTYSGNKYYYKLSKSAKITVR